MKKNVCITIKSTQTVDQDKDSTELFTFGAMESTENGFRLYYDESEATGFAGSSVTLEDKERQSHQLFVHRKRKEAPLPLRYGVRRLYDRRMH